MEVTNIPNQQKATNTSAEVLAAGTSTEVAAPAITSIEELTSTQAVGNLDTNEQLIEANGVNSPSEEDFSFKKIVVKRPRKKTEGRKKRPVSPNRLATLESLSYEIMTSTLPINKIKRILPDKQLPVQEKWPILSNYRKQMVLPSVKQSKQRLADDMSVLHTKINEYFDCDNFPLWQYKYVPKEYPTKYRLLKAIETEEIQLPTLPKH